jgi:hypothetical protein
VIDQYVPHELRGNAKKVSFVLPLRRFFVKHPQICFMNERSALQGVVGAFLPKVTAGDAAQFRVNQGNQLFPSVLIPVAPIKQQLTDPFGRFWTHRWSPMGPNRGVSGHANIQLEESTEI